MSTRIYGGIRFHTRDFPTLHHQLLVAGHRLRRAAVVHCTDILVQRAVRRADLAGLEGTPRRSYLNDAMAELMGDITEANETPRRTPLWLGFEVAVIPFEGCLYGIQIGKPCDQSAFEAVGFDDYHYQNQSDRPDTISEAEWAERERVWDGIFATSPASIISEVSAVYSLVPKTPETGIGDTDDLKAALERIDSARFVDLAKERLWERAFEQGATFDGLKIEGTEVSEAPGYTIKARDAFVAWLSQAEGKKTLHEEKVWIGTKIPAVRTLSQLM